MLKMEGISKRFSGVRALDSVDFSVNSGEVVALVGENGAGKSTLMKILAGIHAPDSGSIHFNGQPITIRSPREAALLGIGIIHQELEVIDTLDLGANIFLGREPVKLGPLRIVDREKIYTQSQTLLARLGLDLSPQTLLGALSTAQRQLVEIARALSQQPRILVMDEPTSSLTLSETDRLIEIVKTLRSDGVGIVYISHRLNEVEKLADRVIVLRDGQNAGELVGEDIERDRMVRMMAGRDLAPSQNLGAAPLQGPSFELIGVRTARHPANEISISIRKGEILGLAGLVGAGRSELSQAIFGIEPRRGGSVVLEGATIDIRSPQDAIRNGIYLVPEDRSNAGLITSMKVRENISLPDVFRFAIAGWARKIAWIRTKSESAAAQASCRDLNIKTPSVETLVSSLSGGNQQKIVLAKWLALNPKVMLFDEPTRGIDVGSKAEIYLLMRRLADSGVAILMISSDMEEILANSDRVAVMHEGRLTGILPRSECTQEAILQLAVA